MSNKKMLQIRHRGNPNSDGSFGDVQGEWTDEGVFSFNKYGEVSNAGSKFLRSIDRDRYEIRWVPVTKESIHETATLVVNSDNGEVSGSTTFQAEDTIELARLLKHAGIESAQFNGSATLTVDGVVGSSTMSSTIASPDLRSIMQLLEPEFQAVGDQEADIEDQAAEEPEAEEVPTDNRAQAHADLDAAFDDGQEAGVEIYDPGMSPYDMEAPKDQAVDVEFDADGNLSMAEPEVDEGIINESNPTLVLSRDPNDGYDSIWSFQSAADATVFINMENDYFAGGRFGGFEAASVLSPDELKGVTPPSESAPEGCMDIFSAAEDGEYDDDEFERWREDNQQYSVDAEGFSWNNDEENDDIEETADYDYRTHDVHPKAYTGKSNYAPPQFKTKYTPARQSDNPIEESSSNTGSFRTWILDPVDMTSTNELEVTVHYHFDNGDFDTGLDYPSVANQGSTMTIENVLTDSGEDILDQLSGSQLEGLEQEAIDHYNEADLPESVEATGPKTFADYVKEAELRELSRGGIRNYVDAVNDRGYDHEDDVDPRELRRRGRGLGMAQSKSYWGDARVNATESDGDRYDIEGTICNYKIVDTQTGKTVEDNIRSGNAAMDALKYWNSKASETTVESLIDEYGRYDRAADFQRKQTQFGPAFHLNTDCGFASLEDINNGLGYFDNKDGFTVLEIDRNGKKGLNYITSFDKAPVGTNVTVVTQTSTGQKYRPGKVMAAFTADELEHQFDSVVAQLRRLGITPNKKLSVKTFD